MAHYAELFRSFEVAGRVGAAHAMPYETDQPIYVLGDMKLPLQDQWLSVKKYQ